MNHKLLILAKRYNVIVEFKGPNGVLTGHKNFLEYNPNKIGFSNYSLIQAVIDILHSNPDEKIWGPHSTLMGYDVVYNAIMGKWGHQYPLEYLGKSAICEISEKMISQIPFLKGLAGTIYKQKAMRTM